MSDKQFIQQAISLATENVKVGGRPFGAVIVKNGQVIAHAVNQITATNDPTAHAELLATCCHRRLLIWFICWSNSGVNINHGNCFNGAFYFLS